MATDARPLSSPASLHRLPLPHPPSPCRRLRRPAPFTLPLSASASRRSTPRAPPSACTSQPRSRPACPANFMARRTTPPRRESPAVSGPSRGLMSALNRPWASPQRRGNDITGVETTRQQCELAKPALKSPSARPFDQPRTLCCCTTIPLGHYQASCTRAHALAPGRLSSPTGGCRRAQGARCASPWLSPVKSRPWLQRARPSFWPWLHVVLSPTQ
jgi:hypothetical protein